MNKLNPRNKICFQSNQFIVFGLNSGNLRKKKWSVLRKKNKISKKFRIKPEKRKQFFQKRLFEKQKLRYFYGCIPQYQLKNIFQKLKKKKNQINFFNKFIVKLESRLDIILVRLRLATTVFESKQLISHKKVTINNEIVNKSNYILRQGDIINRMIPISNTNE